MDVRAAPDCLLCGNPGRLLHRNLRDRIFQAPGEWAHRYCARCGLTWLDPQPLPTMVASLYHQYFWHVDAPVRAQSGARSTLRALALRRLGYDVAVSDASLLMRVAARLPFIEEMVAADAMWLASQPGGKVLDVGCGRGDLLVNLQQLGWSVSGIEPEPAAAAAAAQRLGRPVFAGGIETATLAADHFDAVVLNHVVEHLTDPIEALRRCARALKPGGRLVILTPNTRSFGRRLFGADWLNWDPPRHLYIFDERSLRSVLERAGLHINTQRTLSRKARWAWHASRMIQASQRPTHEHAPRPVSQRTAAWLLQLSEHASAPFTAAGEELYAVATRS